MSNKINNCHLLTLRKRIGTVVSLHFLVLFFVGVNSLFAQQDPQYSQYMFNQLSINPAYTGSKEAISSAIFLRGQQFSGFEGAPRTGTFTVHSPLRNKKVALGFTVISDEIGPTKSTGALASYAYRIKIRDGKLSFGLRMGIYQYMFNWFKVTYKDPFDNPSQDNYTKWVPTADAGLYYYTNSMYAGFSATHLFRGVLLNSPNLKSELSLSRHFFFTAGKAWALSDKLIFSPSTMIKYVPNAPITADINLSFLLQQRLWLGLSVRTGYGIVAYTQFNITDKFKIGYAYDFGIANKVNGLGGSHEIMISYDFKLAKPQFFSPRYF
jgi:type IX secretion system PorP/SprF family membrane protein